MALRRPRRWLVRVLDAAVPTAIMGDMETMTRTAARKAETESRVLVDLRTLDLRTKVFAELRALSADVERPKPPTNLG